MGKALADENVYFLEEPLAPDDFDGFARLVESSPTPIATGEKETTRFGGQDLMIRGNLRIIQPDIGRVGGFTEARRIAAPAEARNVQIIPHCWSTDIIVSVTLHYIASLSKCPYLEFDVFDQPLRSQLVKNPMSAKEGIVRVPEGPGLGIELNEEIINHFRWSPSR